MVVTHATPLLASPWRDARWLILAPHADDETLGTGALIADVASRGRLAAVVVLTDGSGSHPCPTRADRIRLIRRRRIEAKRAVRILAGPRSRSPIFLDWPDAHPHDIDGPQAARCIRRLGTLVRRLRIDAIATTAAREPHCDHAACHRLAVRVVRSAKRKLGLFDYIVWGEAPTTGRTLRTAAMLPGRRRAALQAHRSQLGGGADGGFRLSADKRRMAADDLLYWTNPHDRA